VRDYMLYRGFGPPVSSVPAARQGRIVTLTVVSRALGGRRERVLVYLPADYAQQPAERYPVVYLLHGTPGDPRTAYVNSLHIGPRMDALIASGASNPMIIVMPPGSPSTYVRATEWANGVSPGSGWFTYLTRDLAHAVDSHFRTIATGHGRGIGGYSSGADAALNAAILRPGRYGVVEGWSGDYHQAPSTVGNVPALVRRFSAVSTARDAAPAIAHDGTHVYLYAGANDRVLPATKSVVRSLRAGGVRARVAITHGGHSWMLWASRLDGALRYFSDHLASPR
jgi:enterochelin esterase-like enzyme